MKKRICKILIFCICFTVSMSAYMYFIEADSVFASEDSAGAGTDIIKDKGGIYYLGDEDATEETVSEEDIQQDRKESSAETEYFTERKSGKYTVLTLLVQDGEDVYKACQKALNEAKECATDKNPYKVIIPAGSYTLKTSLSIYSNTWLIAKGASIIIEDGGRMLRNGTDTEGKSGKWAGYGPMKNITVQGGTWDGNAKAALKRQKKEKTDCTFSNMRFGHMKNLIVKDAVIKNNLGAHHLELGAVKDAVIKDCVFSDYVRNGKKTPYEAVQIDTVTQGSFINYKKYDKTMSRDITVKNNTFKNVGRGVGSHSAFKGKYYKKIKICNNRFSGISSYAVGCFNYKSSVVSGNTIKSSSGGILSAGVTSGQKTSVSIHDNNISVKGTGIALISARGVKIRNNNVKAIKGADVYATSRSSIKTLKKNKLSKTNGKSIIIIEGKSSSPVGTKKGLIIKYMKRSSVKVKAPAKKMRVYARVNGKLAGSGKSGTKNKSIKIKLKRSLKKGAELTLLVKDKNKNLYIRKELR